MQVGILVGRFQPLHIGHVQAIKFALKNSNKLFIVIGSAEKSNQKRNPFTFEERKKMIELSINDESLDKKRIEIIPIKDAKNHAEWISSIKKAIGEYELIFTNDEITEMLFRKDNVKVINVPLLNRETLSATEVRKKIELDSNWMNLVTPVIAKYLIDINASNRIKSIT